MTLSPKPIFVKVLLIEQTLLKGASVSVRIRLRGMRLMRLSYKLCHDKKKHNFVTTQKNYEQQYGF